MTTVSTFRPRTRRNIELVLLIFAVLIVLLAYLNVGLATAGKIPVDLFTQGIWVLAFAIAFHLVLRWRAAYADPLLLPVATLLNGLGIVIIHRLDIAVGSVSGVAPRQIMWAGLSMVVAAIVLVTLRDHRILRRYTFTAMASGLVALLLPLLPVIGIEAGGAQIWIRIGPFSFQPGELAKILLAVFFAGYLIQTRDALSLAGKEIFGIRLPRARDLGPILIAWALSVAVLVFQRDLGTSLLFFGLFVGMLYIATERKSWIAIGMTLFCGGAFVAYLLFAHLQRRVHIWLDPWAPEYFDQSYQLRQGLYGLGAGGMLGTGLGQGRPNLTPLADSDFIIASLGEELGLVGIFAVLVLYALLIERGLRTALGTRDGFGKLLAAGLSFTMALQVFTIVGGVLRVIPLTGLTTPFLSAGGSSLLANWAIVAILLRISDHARRPLPDPDETSAAADAPTSVVKSP
ncbi:cell elongation-specific peptidoglycan biosynthesis regulator RodA [Austwickia chelonae]|uniref:Cell division protein RodA n=1 Tax=Austwickia chelonae NBRC 105200 TaxID=1184607 RepID=K6VQT9_9MICO|nr:FtsW/RodA/SpoVE family cell cycle protein [Austwickia chelonae]GAB79094.1 cell division protein RodA [Austwickia chelonae NBRC 105200]SEW42216.1 cell elongation-specific peptidoglycan biosynthesis regulator RodA [Austwickia chelonae]